MSGPLGGLRVVELGGIGPGPHAAMVLADLGAEVVRVDRPGHTVPSAAADQTLRNRHSVLADLKRPEDLARVRSLVGRADVLIEGFRPGVIERIGLDPAGLIAENPGLVVARMTGWGQDGPWADRVGHDLNYISVTGALDAIRREGQLPTVPLNLVGDYGGGSMLLVVGVLAALWERERSGHGQVVDAAMVDGATLLTQAFWNLRNRGEWTPGGAGNVVDGGAPFYDVYACADGLEVAVGCLEAPFWSAFLRGLEIAEDTLPDQYDRAHWPRVKAQVGQVLARQDRAHWLQVFEGTDACLTPVLTFDEAAEHPHLIGRGTLVDVDQVRQAAPAPRFSRTQTSGPRPPRQPGADTERVLDPDWWART